MRPQHAKTPTFRGEMLPIFSDKNRSKTTQAWFLVGLINAEK